METTAKVTRRAYSIFIDNPANGNPSTTFEEEKLIEVDGELVHHPIGSTRIMFDMNDEQALELYTLLKAYYEKNILNPVVEELVVVDELEETTTDEEGLVQTEEENING